MRHRVRGRKLGRNPSHRKAMFRNMACSLIRSLRSNESDKNKPRVAGRIVTTVAKAKELRPYVEKLVTMARKGAEHKQRAEQYATSAERNSSEWKSWRESEQWQQWNQAIAPSITYRQRVFSILRDREAVDILFKELADRFADRPGGYTRVIKLVKVRLGDSGKQALIEFVGERDRVKAKRKAPVVTEAEETTETDAPEEADAEVEASTEAEAPSDEAEEGKQE